MAKDLGHALVIDIESTCWPYPHRAPPGEISEIIEIGLCLVDLKKIERVEKERIIVRPMRSKVSSFCTELTTLTQSEVNRGILLVDALDVLRNKYHCDQRLMVSWGDYDRNHFRRNCDAYRLENPFGPTHLNVKTLFSIAHDCDAELELDDAMQREGLEMEGRHHRGVDDAWNTALLYCRLMQRLRDKS